MDQDEQSFAIAHLSFLNLQAQAAALRVLTQVRDLLDEVAESLTVALEASLVEPADDQEEEDDDDEQPMDVPEDDEDPAEVPSPQLAEVTQDDEPSDQTDEAEGDE